MRKSVSGVLVVIMLLAILAPFNWFSAFAGTEQTLFINEVMSSNESTIRDGDVDDPEFGSLGGAYSDWIEIYNAGAQDVDLTGYTIADSSAVWTFPEGVIPAGGHLLIWASDKDKVTGGQLHANFKLSASGESLLFKAPNGTVVDSITIISLDDDQSYGRKNDGSSEMSLLKPTPGSANIFDLSTVPVLEPVFSHEGGFYTAEFDLQIDAEESEVKIYYTTDCSDPVPGEDGTFEYSRGISIKSRKGDPNVLSMIKDISNDEWNQWRAPNGEIFKCTTIKAVAVREDGAQSKVVTNSYFVDQNMNTRYTLPVVSLVTEYENLFDESTGLYVNENYEKSGSDWERPVHIEVFDTDGSTWFSQNAGMRIHGGWTRKYPQKSFRLYAKDDYDDVDKFKYEIFPGLRGKGTEKKIKSFKRLILRNAGNDWTSALFRDEMMQSLVSHLTLDTQSYRPCIAFLNGEYWGVYHIRERFDEKYLKEHYDLDDDRVAILDVYEETSVQEGEPEDVLAYTDEVINYLKSHSITDKSTYDYIKTKIDVENFIDYNVAEIFFGNTDWPGNNVSIWKYKTEDGEYDPDADYGLDGRWRWFLKDTDFGFGLYGKSVSHNTLAFAAGDTQEGYANAPWSVFLFKTLLQNPDFRNEFINRFADQLNTSFVSSRVNEVIDDVISTLEPEMQEHTDRWPFIKLTKTNYWDKTWSQDVQEIKNYADRRPGYVRQHIVSKFGANGVTGSSFVTLNTDTSMGHIKINSIDIQSGTPSVTNPDSWTGMYFRGVPVTVKAMPEEGYEFDHWEGITGVDQSSDAVTFTLSEDTNITAVFKPMLAPPTLFGDVNADGEINSTDLTVLKRYLLRTLRPDYYFDTKAADVDTSESINSTDVTYLKRYLLRKIDKFPAQK